jgi:predicted PurR-regulated permease PerM
MMGDERPQDVKAAPGRVPAGTGSPGPAALTDPGATSATGGPPPDVGLVANSPLVPDWLTNIAALGWRVLVVAALLLVGSLLLTVFWTVTASILVAVIISAVFAPMVLRLRAGGQSRTKAAAVVWATAILIIGGALLLLVLAFLPYAAELVLRVDQGLSSLQAQLAELGLPAAVSEAGQHVWGTLDSGAGDRLGALVAAAAEAVTIAILATFLVFFFLRDGDKAWLWLFQATTDQKRELITTAGDDALARVGGYLRGTTVLAAAIAVTDYLFMLVLGVPLALPLALLAFLTGYIPYFGGIVSTLVILLVTYGALGSGPLVVMVLLMGIRGLVLGYAVRPQVYGRTVSIHPAIVLLALPAGFQLAGVIGVFAAVPVSAVIIAVAGAVVRIVEPDPPPPLPGLVPAWLDRMAQFSWRILVVVGLVGLAVLIMVTLPLVVIPVIVALILAATLRPVVDWLTARGWAGGRAAAAAVGGGTMLVVAILALTVASLVQQASDLEVEVTRGASETNAALGGILGLPEESIAAGVRQGVQVVMSLAEALGTVGAITLLGILLAFYLLKDGGRLWTWLAPHLPHGSRTEVQAAGSRAFDVLGGYMIGTGAISLVGAGSQWLIMVLLGLPLALPVFVLSFFLGFIPYIGSFISTALAFLIAVAVGDTMDIVVMGIWTIVFNLVAGNIVSPIVYGRTVHIHPAIVLVAIPAAAAVAGPLGMFVVVPALGIVSATWRTVLALMAEPRPGGRREEPLPEESAVSPVASG